MSACHRSRTLQDYLDGALSAARARDLEAHLDGCAGCRRELEGFRRLFAALERAPLFDPGTRLTERVLAAALPRRRRVHWIRAIGWTYAASLAVSALCVLGVIALASQPAVRAWADLVVGRASGGFVASVTFVLQTVSHALLLLADGWSGLLAVGQWIAPLSRAMGALFAQPVVAGSTMAAALVCCGLLARMLARRERRERGVRIGIVGV